MSHSSGGGGEDGWPLNEAQAMALHGFAQTVEDVRDNGQIWSELGSYLPPSSYLL